MAETIVVSARDGWAEVRINREEKRNAMNRATREGLANALAQLRGKAKAIVLTGTGGSFCAGIDLKEVEQDRAAGIDSSSEEWIGVNLAIRAHPAIFIAAVNGLALGGGSTMINVCDLAVASIKASIGCPEMGFATYPGMAGPALQLSGVTRKQAAWMILTATRIGGETAARWGMVNECVEPEDLLPRAHAIAEGISRFDAVALAESKKAIDRIPAFITDWKEAMDHGQMVNEVIRSKTRAQEIGRANFATGGKNPGQGI
ncbi:enoyl-CoA hydratase/isomerase family protein [Methylocapsa sp. S129]|uniref:enoyl-CoA hydratase/isomerase family protein n=1 Tax=Methylocapsa sp. S129 TaxID=1641869 RepID=UPI00131AD03A|nr:enoyl-CoA hydratase/isomerase family protein [Methylocapsa sp. S129]